MKSKERYRQFRVLSPAGDEYWDWDTVIYSQLFRQSCRAHQAQSCSYCRANSQHQQLLNYHLQQQLSLQNTPQHFTSPSLLNIPCRTKWKRAIQTIQNNLFYFLWWQRSMTGLCLPHWSSLCHWWQFTVNKRFPIDLVLENKFYVCFESIQLFVSMELIILS